MTMNAQAFFDGVLALAALWLAAGPVGRARPAVRLGALLLAAAAVLGTLRFSGVLPLPRLHQTMSMFGAGVGLPLLAAALWWPEGGVARQPRYAWVFAVCAAVLCVLVVVLAQRPVWTAAAALLAVVAMLLRSAARRQAWGMAAAAAIGAALLAFAAKQPLGPLAPGDVLHIGLAVGLWLYAQAMRALDATGAHRPAAVAAQ